MTHRDLFKRALGALTALPFVGKWLAPEPKSKWIICCEYIRVKRTINSAGGPFEPPIEVEDALPVLTITRNCGVSKLYVLGPDGHPQELEQALEQAGPNGYVCLLPSAYQIRSQA